jgi:hypothetical protein
LSSHATSSRRIVLNAETNSQYSYDVRRIWGDYIIAVSKVSRLERAIAGTNRCGSAWLAHRRAKRVFVLISQVPDDLISYQQVTIRHREPRGDVGLPGSAHEMMLEKNSDGIAAFFESWIEKNVH